MDTTLTTEGLLAAYKQAQQTVPIDCSDWPRDAEYWEGQMFDYKGVKHFLAFDLFWMVTEEGLASCSHKGQA